MLSRCSTDANEVFDRVLRGYSLRWNTLSPTWEHFIPNVGTSRSHAGNLHLRLQFFYLYAKDVYAGTVVECGSVEVVAVKLSHIAVAADLVVWVVPRRAMALITLNSGLRTLLKVVDRLL